MKRTNDEQVGSKRQKIEHDENPVQVKYTYGDHPEMQGIQMDHQGGFSSALKIRGLNFIKAAQFIIKHSKDIDVRKKDLAETYLKEQYQAWDKTQKNLKKQDFLEMEKNLILSINEVLYNNKKKFKEVKKEIENAENHLNWKARPSIKTSFDKGEWHIYRVENPIQSLTHEQLEEWRSILTEDKKPEWFSDLPEWEKNYLTQKIQSWSSLPQNDRVNLGDAMGVVPTTIRRYPGAANAYHTEINFYQDGQCVYTFKKIRSGVLAPFNIKKFQSKVDITYQNLCQLVVAHFKEQKKEQSKSEVNILLQTLYSAPFQPDSASNKAMNQAVLRLRNEFETEEGTQSFFEKNGFDLTSNTIPKIKLLYSNRPVNSVRSLSHYWLKNDFISQESQKTVESIEALVQKYLSKNTDPIKKDLISKAFTSYKEMANKLKNKSVFSLFGDMLDNIAFAQSYLRFKWTFGQGQNIDSEMAALEQILMNELGVRMGSCVSGKDREEMVTMMAAAQLEYYFKHQEFPPAPGQGTEQQRNEYYEFIAHHYLSGHGMKLAGENALGCDGLKNVHDVFGKEISAVIKRVAKEQYHIDIDIYDPILTTQKVAGLNKPSPSDPNAYHLPFKRTAGTALAFVGLTVLSGSVLNPFTIVGGAVLSNGLLDMGCALKNRILGTKSKSVLFSFGTSPEAQPSNNQDDKNDLKRKPEDQGGSSKRLKI